MSELSDADVAEMHRVIDIERDELADLFERIASVRQSDPDAATDPRFAEAAIGIRKIAATLGDQDCWRRPERRARLRRADHRRADPLKLSASTDTVPSCS